MIGNCIILDDLLLDMKFITFAFQGNIPAIKYCDYCGVNLRFHFEQLPMDGDYPCRPIDIISMLSQCSFIVRVIEVQRMHAQLLDKSRHKLVENELHYWNCSLNRNPFAFGNVYINIRKANNFCLIGIEYCVHFGGYHFEAYPDDIVVQCCCSNRR